MGVYVRQPKAGTYSVKLSIQYTLSTTASSGGANVTWTDIQGGKVLHHDRTEPLKRSVSGKKTFTIDVEIENADELTHVLKYDVRIAHASGATGKTSATSTIDVLSISGSK